MVTDLIKTICDVIRATMLNVEPVRECEGVQNQPRSHHFQLFLGFLEYQLSN